MIEDGLFSLMSADVTVQDFWQTDNNGTRAYQMYYLGTFDPVKATPYLTFNRYKRTSEIDLGSYNRMYNSGYYFEIYHYDSWLLLDLQQRVSTFLESLSLKTIGGIYIQKVQVMDDFHKFPRESDEDKIRLFQGILEVEIDHNSA